MAKEKIRGLVGAPGQGCLEKRAGVGGGLGGAGRRGRCGCSEPGQVGQAQGEGGSSRQGGPAGLFSSAASREDEEGSARARAGSTKGRSASPATESLRKFLLWVAEGHSGTINQN